MDAQGWVLIGWALGSVLLLGGVEAWCVIAGVPTISARVRELGQNASIVVILTAFIIGYLMAHFWDNFVSRGPKDKS